MNTKRTGDITELQCITYLFELGFEISIPYGENSRYDFIIDNGKDLLKIQCKTCQVYKDKIVIPCRSIRSNTKFNRMIAYSKDEIDYFITYYNHKCYMIPIEEGIKLKTLRFEKPRNNQVQNISYLADYEAEKVLKNYLLH